MSTCWARCENSPGHSIHCVHWPMVAALSSSLRWKIRDLPDRWPQSTIDRSVENNYTSKSIGGRIKWTLCGGGHSGEVTACTGLTVLVIPCSADTLILYAQFLRPSFKSVHSIMNYVNGVWVLLHLFHDTLFPNLSDFEFKLFILSMLNDNSKFDTNITISWPLSWNLGCFPGLFMAKSRPFLLRPVWTL